MIFTTPVPTVLTWDMISSIANNVVTALPVTNLVAILGGMVSLGIIFVLVWAFGRRGLRSIVSAMSRGKMKI